MTTLSIPPSVADVTPGWLTAALRAGGRSQSAAVASIAISQIGVGVGIMGELFRVELDYDGDSADAPASVIVKLPATSVENRAQGVALGMYEAEVRFYRQLAAHTSARTPTCFYADIVPGTAESVLVLEDLGGLSSVDQVAGMSIAQARVAVAALASLHASWWGRVTAADYEWIPSVVHARIQNVAGLYPTLWPAFVANFGDRLPEGGIAAGEVFRDRWWEVMQALGRMPWTLIHEDFRCDNLFFEHDLNGADSVVVLDWQAIGRGPGVYDLAYVLGGSLTVADRRAHERELVAHYHDGLVAAGVTDYPIEQLWHDYRLAHLAGGPAVTVLTGATFDLGNVRGGQLIGAFTERHFSAIVDLDAVALIP